MPKKKQFYQATVCNVVLRTKDKRGWKDFIGTRWPGGDPYGDWLVSKDWLCTRRGSYEKDGVPCDAPLGGEPVYLSREQMQNDESPLDEKPWKQDECERYCALADVKGAGWVVALGDPAPRAVGSVGGRDERWRKDGTKNWWANVIVKLRRKGDAMQIIWLDAEQSREWGLEQGMDALAQLGIKWHANEGYAETTSTPVYADAFLRSCRELGFRGYVIGSRRKQDPKDRLEQTYNSEAKKNYLVALADRARAGEFLICDSVPKEMVDIFLSQMRGFMPLPDGRTGIPFDDLVNALAFATDPYFRIRYPVVAEGFSRRFDPLGDDTVVDQYPSRTRHSAA